MHFWLVVARGTGRGSWPVNTSLNGAMPAFTNISVGSFCGTIGALAIGVWPWAAKKSRNDARTSCALLVEPNMVHGRLSHRRRAEMR